MEGGLRTRGIIKSSTPAEPLLSVITVVYNGAAHIERAFESVLLQDYSNIEYIVVDGGSSDGTIEIIKGHENKIDYWVSEPDNGIYDAMNKGVAISKGDLIGFLNSDDYYEPGSIKEVIATYLETGYRGIFFGNSYVIQEDLGIRYISVGNASLWRGLGFKHQAMFVHRYVYEQIGLYNIAYRIAADYDFVVNAVAKGVRLVHIDKNLVNYSNMGVSGINRIETLNEIKMIGRGYFGLFSLPYLGFMMIFLRSCLFQGVGRLVYFAFGEKALLAVRSIYTRIKYNNPNCR
jgi:glycosyltransferase involved in cell wall biosynthesis